MTRTEQIRQLNRQLLAEMPQYRAQAAQFPAEEAAQRRLLRSLMNVRPPMPLTPEFLTLQDALLRAEAAGKGIVSLAELTPTRVPNLYLWQGDITRLAVDAIVNAANAALLGCFIPCHGCIDNAIHSAAGLQLRNECRQIMAAQGHEEPNGQAKLTGAYNLPASHILHTVGPVVRQGVTERDRRELKSCYEACLRLAAAHHLHSVAFCCISTGEFHFPNQEAAEIAVSAVRAYLSGDKKGMQVVFNVFKDADRDIYRKLLGVG